MSSIKIKTTLSKIWDLSIGEIQDKDGNILQGIQEPFNDYRFKLEQFFLGYQIPATSNIEVLVKEDGTATIEDWCSKHPMAHWDQQPKHRGMVIVQGKQNPDDLANLEQFSLGDAFNISQIIGLDGFEVL